MFHDPGAHGIFDEQSKERSAAWALSRHGRAIDLGAGVAIAAATSATIRATRS